MNHSFLTGETKTMNRESWLSYIIHPWSRADVIHVPSVQDDGVEDYWTIHDLTLFSPHSYGVSSIWTAQTVLFVVMILILVVTLLLDTFVTISTINSIISSI